MKKIIKSWPILLIIAIAALLRLVLLDKFPFGLNADEAAIGYNAYSLLETGRDEHGTIWPLVFRSFDDYKPPLYFYLVMPLVKLIGLNTWAIRLPSALLGIFSVWLIYAITKEIFGKKSKIPLLSSLILALSPWHLHFSRGGWEVNTGATFLLLGLWAFFKSKKNSKFFILSAISFILSLYAYHSMRIIIPLLGLFLLVCNRSFFKRTFSQAKPKKHLLISLVLGFLLTLPLIGQMLSPEGQSRFSGVSVFADEGPLWEALELRAEHSNVNSLGVRLLHNKYLTYFIRFSKNYLSHYSPRFLFITGDEIARSKVPGIGQSLIVLAPFFFLGLLSLLKLDNKAKKFTLFWFVIAPLAAALTFQSPHALRAQNMVFPFVITIALGVSSFFEFLKKNKLIRNIIAGILLLLFSYNASQYLHHYYIHYPREYPYAWQYGFDQITDFVKENGDQYDQIIMSNRYDQPYILFAFYLKYPPQKFQEEIKLVPRDKFGFSTVNNFGKYTFKKINWDEDSQVKNALIISTEEGVPDSATIHIIDDPAGNHMYRFAESNYDSIGN